MNINKHLQLFIIIISILFIGIFVFFSQNFSISQPTIKAQSSYVPIGEGCTNAYYIDKDCDGYGVASPLGVDADDNDPEVNTPETVITKYKTLTNFLHHLDYYPDRIFYIATNGNDNTGEVNNINKPYKTWDAVKPQLQPGDAVIYRGGTYGRLTTDNLKGIADKPIIFMTYPGEKVVIDGAYDSIGAAYTSYLVFDGFILDNSEDEYGRGINGHYFNHVTFRNIEAKGHSNGMHCGQKLHDILIENCVFHDNLSSHGIYLNGDTIEKKAENIIVRNCIMYRNGRHGFQFNGDADNILCENNIIHSNRLGGFSLLRGVRNSIFRNNLIFNNTRPGFIFFIYDSSYGDERSEDNNLIINNIVWEGKYENEMGGGTQEYKSAVVFNDSIGNFTFTNNIFRNNIFVTYSAETFYFQQHRHFPSTTIENNIFYKMGNNPDIVMLSDQGDYDFETFESMSTLVKNNLLANPKFTDTSIDYSLDPEKFNFDYLSDSPAINFGITTDAPSTDLRSNLRDKNPDAGCYEYGETSTNKPPVANAGDDIIVVDMDNDWQENVTLDASQSYDPDGQIVHYLWYERDDQIGNQKTITLSLSVGIHQIKLMTIDNKGASSYDMITVEVKPGPNVIILKEGLHSAIRSDLPDKHISYNSGGRKIGGSSNQIWRLFLIFNNLDSILGGIPEDNQIIEAKLKLYEYAYSKAESKSVSIYSLKHSFDPDTVTWNSYAEGKLWSTPGAYDENDIDITPLATVTLDNQVNIWREWDITTYIKQLRNGTKQNYGFLLKQDDETEEGESRYKMTNDSDVSLRPKLVIVLSKPLFGIIDSSLPDGIVGEQYNYSLHAAGGNPPYTYSITSGNLPPGLNLSGDGVISGKPTQSGNYNFTIKVTDSSNNEDTKEFTLIVNDEQTQPLTITTESLPEGTVGTEYNATLSASGGTTPYTWSVTPSDLPDGLSLNSSTGIISGTPTTQGTFNFTVQVKDNENNTTTKSLSITINSPSDTTPPVRSNGSPTGELSAGTTQTTLSLTTDENATCKYSTTSGVPYSSMTNTFSNTGETSHSTTITGLSNGNTYNYYIKCIDTSNNANTDDYLISFSIASPQPKPTGDLNQDNKVDSKDFQILIQKFRQTQGIGKEDLNSDGIVDAKDIGIMMHYWTN